MKVQSSGCGSATVEELARQIARLFEEDDEQVRAA
jgi:hypothetical protein